jgi:long-subunit acyl-CoA synthetase (AMP-forming)
LVLNRIKKHLGLDRVEKLFFGAAPLSDKVKKFFASLNMPLINTYGLSETSGAATFMEYWNINISKSGHPFPGT